MRAIFSSENDPTATPAVGRNECGPEDQVAVMESVLAVPRMGNRAAGTQPGCPAILGGRVFVWLGLGVKGDESVQNVT